MIPCCKNCGRQFFAVLETRDLHVIGVSVATQGLELEGYCKYVEVWFCQSCKTSQSIKPAELLIWNRARQLQETLSAST